MRRLSAMMTLRDKIIIGLLYAVVIIGVLVPDLMGFLERAL